MLVGFAPAGMEGFFRESGRAAVDDGPAPPLDDDEIARTLVAASKYGVEAVALKARTAGVEDARRSGALAVVVGARRRG